MSRRRRGHRADGPHGVLLVDKPAGATSAAVVDWVRWCLGVGVGHCGTLDPDATGLLIVAVGRATRLSALLTHDDKTYRAEFELGRATTTADAAGDTTATAEVSEADLEAALERLQGWGGTFMLRPPAFSAVKIEGKRAHQLARQGEAPQLEPRPMTVLEVRDAARADERRVAVTLRVSKGTYVRSLAEELGRQIDRPAHMARLRRLQSGCFDIDDPRVLSGLSVEPLPSPPGAKPRVRIRWPGAELDRTGQAAALRDHLIGLRDAAPTPRVLVQSDAAGERLLRALAHGRPVPDDDPGWAQGWPAGLERAVVMSAQADALGMFVVRADAGRAGPELRSERTVEPLSTTAPARGSSAPYAHGDANEPGS